MTAHSMSPAPSNERARQPETASGQHLSGRPASMPTRQRHLGTAEESRMARPASASATRLTDVMRVTHANNGGYVDGAVLMRLVDDAAGVAAIRHSGCHAVTASIDEMTFESAVKIGDVVHADAAVSDVHGASIEVAVEVSVETLADGTLHRVATAHLVFVTVNDDGRPTPARPLMVGSDDEQRRQDEARVRRQHRSLRAQALRQIRARSR